MKRWTMWGPTLLGLLWLWGCAASRDSAGASNLKAAEESLRAGNPSTTRRLLEGQPARTPAEEVVLGDACLALADHAAATRSYYAARNGGGTETEYRALMGLGQVAASLGTPYEAAARFLDAQRATPDAWSKDKARLAEAKAYLQAQNTGAARLIRASITRIDIPGLSELDGRLGSAPPSSPSSGARPIMTSDPAPEIQRNSATRATPPRPMAGGAPRILSRAAWRAAPIRGDVHAMGRVRRITVHHTADSDPGASEAASANRLKSYQADHQRNKHWADIGYHFVIDPQGRIWEGRELKWQGAHAGSPEANEGNIGVAVLGHFENTRPTSAQVAGLRELVHSLQRTYGVPSRAIDGHDAVIKHHDPGRGTVCPGRYLKPFVDDLRRSPRAAGL